jgi:superfamily II DNA or RNA helicase
MVIDLPKAVHHKLVEIAPPDLRELQIERWYIAKEPRKRIVVLRDYQKEAVGSWLRNDMKGVFEMATGTGKTYAALGCLRALMNREDELITIIACPYSHIITQWIRETDSFGILIDYLVADATNPGWKDELADRLLDLENGVRDRLILFTTHDTFASSDFRTIIQTSSIPVFVIVDEVHGVGAPQRRKGLLDRYRYRLGLSATPERWFDLEGTETLFDYFGGTVYEFPLGKAIGEFLTEYEYHPHFVTLTDQELDQYERETERISRAYYSSKDDKERERWYTLLCVQRQNIVKTAFNKYQALSEILASNKELKHCLVYCAPQQLEKVQDILLEHNVRQHRFTEAEGTRPEARYGGISERDYLLRQFSSGTLQALVAMKCLDEGVDIPPARLAIILCNSGNPREHVQRTGRILRKYPGKKIAIIHDIIVVPSATSSSGSPCNELERRIFLRELKRYKEFAYTAKNAVTCLAQVERLEEEYGVLGGAPYVPTDKP